jgi:hypothetical protein
MKACYGFSLPLFFGIMVSSFHLLNFITEKKLQNTMEILRITPQKNTKQMPGALTEEHGHPTNVRPLDFP